MTSPEAKSCLKECLGSWRGGGEEGGQEERNSLSCGRLSQECKGQGMIGLPDLHPRVQKEAHQPLSSCEDSGLQVL